MSNFVIAQKSLILFDEKVLILQKSGFKWKENENKWDFAGGCLEFGENLPEGLAREIREETGLTVSISKLLFASTHIPVSHGQKQFVFLYYLGYSNTDKVILSDEHKGYLWATRKQVLELVEGSLLNDLIQNEVFDAIEKIV